MPTTPQVFISSTSEDLEPYRKAAEDAALKSGFFPVMFEYWAAGGNPPLQECLDRVEPADLLVVLVAKRYGWVPEGGTRSITWLECEQAKKQGIKVLPFVLDEATDWPARFDESHRMDEALDTGVSDDKIDRLNGEILRNKRQLRVFRNWLNDISIRGTFRSPDDLGGQLVHALYEWRHRHGIGDGEEERDQSFQRSVYLDWIKNECESIELLGLELKEAHNVRLGGQIYVPAVTEPRADVKARQEPEFQGENKPVLLLDQLGEESLYVPGAPGAGKSVFCRWVAWLTAAGTIPAHEIPAPEEFRETLPETLAGRLPVLCRLRDFAETRNCAHGNGHWTAVQLEQALACWLDATRPGGLLAKTFLDHLNQGGCLLILDGLDELPVSFHADGRTHYPRRNLVSGLADARPRWTEAGNRLLLTSRPYGLSAKDRLSLGLPEQALAELPDPLQHTFIQRWFAAADYANRAAKSTGLIEHLGTRDDLRELRANPMLLTALCVKYDEGRRLPQDVYKLHGSVVNQVLYNRFAERRETLLSRSGLLMPGGERKAGFYHLSFQEFLAAERLEILGTKIQSLLERRTATAEWRRTLVFYFCAVAERNPQAALDGYATLLDRLKPQALKDDPNPALLLADCLEIAHARSWCLDAFAAPYRAACDQALEIVEPTARARLWDVLGLLGLDGRPGIGLDKNGLPQFDWITVPKGKVRLEGKSGIHKVEPFHIARYPVTQTQFAAFVEADDGFRNPDWWDEEWTEQGWVDPKAPPKARWSVPNRPMDSVSWNEAIAFCRWVSARLGFEVRLPTEMEWQQAATGGNPKNRYPWGGEYRSGYANIDETWDVVGPHFLESTSAVGIYPLGASPQGAMDMSGNVWEWCLNKVNDPADLSQLGEDSRSLRGGSWYYSQGFARAAYRNATSSIRPTVAATSVFECVVCSTSFAAPYGGVKVIPHGRGRFSGMSADQRLRAEGGERLMAQVNPVRTDLAPSGINQTGVPPGPRPGALRS